uniref:28S ribosomal protein S27, mitochondrial n=1 Tax=Pectinophora gossypiella TaxID=13191 RepID=A0A1E1WSS1_PECGO
MLRSLRKIPSRKSISSLYLQRKTFLTNDYKCIEAWNSQISSPILTKVNIHDFYNILDQNFTSKGVISAIDVDIFANAIKDPVYLEELKDLLHKLRLSADTGNTLESTHHATIRNFIEFGHIPELIDILKDPLNFGVFLDNYSANILLDKLITSADYEAAAKVASLIMLQEDFTNDITCSLCQYACYKYITNFTPPEPPAVEEKNEKNKKVEEVKIRIKFLRNPYFDDHFDIKDTLLSAGKTLAWISERSNDTVNNNLQIIGWLVYQKYDKLKSACKHIAETGSPKIFTETIDLIKKECQNGEGETKETLEKCISMLDALGTAETPLEESLKITIENAINKAQNNDISQQKELFKSWIKIREEKLEEQTKRLDRAKRTQLIEEKQKLLEEEEQRLWFFEKEEAIDLQIEEKEKLVEAPSGKTKSSKLSDEEYVPPEILPKRR